MNIKYETGNVVRSTSPENFGIFEFPAELPTEEWAGNEARSYTNYIRPIANLFENDREDSGLTKDLYKGWLFNKNSIVNGCKIEKTTIDNVDYYEVQHGAFINGASGGANDNPKVYYIFPACEALTKQIEREYEAAGNPNTLRVKIVYDYDSETYSCSYILNDVKHTLNTYTKAVPLINDLLTDLGITDRSIESHIVLPIFAGIDNTKIYFNGSKIVSGEPTGTGNTIIATITGGAISTADSVDSTINGQKIQNSTISNSSIINHSVTLGNTVVELGATITNFTGINSINGIQQKIGDTQQDEGDILFYYRTGDTVSTQIKIPHGTTFTLNTACAKAADNDITLATDGNLPTNAAVKGYISTFKAGSIFTGKMTFNGGLEIKNTSALTTNGQIKTTNTANASRNGGTLSGNASIYTAGGIEAVGDIYSNGNIVGINSGTYSKRELKENITDFTEDAVSLINSVKVVNYNYKADAEKNHKIGFIADDTHEYFATKNHNIMDQSNCIGLLLAAVQQLSAENKLLKERLDAIESNNTKRRKKQD